MKYGILGCGNHALQSHAIPAKDSLELTAICDISKSQLDLFEKSYGNNLDKFNDKDKFLSSGIEAVFIGTPDECHYEELVMAINAGKHIFVEKPITVKGEEIKDLKKLLKHASNKGLIVSSCHPRRFDPPFLWLKDHLLELGDRLGLPLEFKFDFSYHMPYKNWKHKRGLLLDHANHEVDLMHYLFGHSGFDATKLADSFDHYHIVGHRDDRMIFNFSGSRRLESRNYFEWATIRFARGEVMLDAHHGIVRIIDHDKDSIDNIQIKATDYGLRGKATLENFFRAITGKEKCYLTTDDLYVNNALSVKLTEHKTWRYSYGDNS